MNVEVELPDLGPDGGEQGTVEQWHFEEGEYVEEGDTLLEVSSDSGTVEVPAPRAGILIERIVDEDEQVRVGEPVALIECSDEAAKPSHDESSDEE